MPYHRRVALYIRHVYATSHAWLHSQHAYSIVAPAPALRLQCCPPRLLQSRPARARLCFVRPAPTCPAALSLCLSCLPALSLPCDTPAHPERWPPTSRDLVRAAEANTTCRRTRSPLLSQQLCPLASCSLSYSVNRSLLSSPKTQHASQAPPTFACLSTCSPARRATITLPTTPAHRPTSTSPSARPTPSTRATRPTGTTQWALPTSPTATMAPRGAAPSSPRWRALVSCCTRLTVLTPPVPTRATQAWTATNSRCRLARRSNPQPLPHPACARPPGTKAPRPTPQPFLAQDLPPLSQRQALN